MEILDIVIRVRIEVCE